jgi:hypothetical protein
MLVGALDLAEHSCKQRTQRVATTTSATNAAIGDQRRHRHPDRKVRGANAFRVARRVTIRNLTPPAHETSAHVRARWAMPRPRAGTRIHQDTMVNAATLMNAAATCMLVAQHHVGTKRSIDSRIRQAFANQVSRSFDHRTAHPWMFNALSIARFHP